MRLFTLFLAMTLCMSAALVSCKKQDADTAGGVVDGKPAITLEEVQADPLAAIEKSASEASQYGVFKTFENIGKLEAAHVSISVPSQASVEVWASAKKDAPGFAIDVYEAASEQSIVANINGKDAVLGIGDVVYGVPVENFKENFENATFWDFAGISPEEFYEELDATLGFSLEELVGKLSGLMEELEQYDALAEEGCLEVLRNANVKVQEQKIGDYDAIVVDYIIDTDLLEDISYWYLDVLESNPIADYITLFWNDYEYEYNSVVDLYEDILDSLIATFDEYVDSLDLKYVINSANGRLSKVLVEFTSSYMADPDAVYCFEADFGEDYMTSDTLLLSAYSVFDGEKEMAASIAIVEKLEENEYSMIVTTTAYEDGEATDEMELLSIEADLEAGRYTATMQGATLQGNVSVKDGYFRANVDGLPLALTVEYAEDSFSFELKINGESILFAIDAEDLPEPPSYTNIFEMDEDDFIKLAELFTFEETAVDEIKQPMEQENAVSELMTIEDYANELQEQHRSLVYYENMQVSIFARDNSIVYQYKYFKDAKIPENLAEGLESESMQEAVLSSLERHRAQVEFEIESIIYEYCDYEDAIIVSREFK